MFATDTIDQTGDVWRVAFGLAASVADAVAFGEPVGPTVDGLGRWLRHQDLDELCAHRDDVERVLDLVGPHHAALIVRWLVARSTDDATQQFWTGLRRHLVAVA